MGAQPPRTCTHEVPELRSCPGNRDEGAYDRSCLGPEQERGSTRRRLGVWLQFAQVLANFRINRFERAVPLQVRFQLGAKLSQTGIRPRVLDRWKVKGSLLGCHVLLEANW